MLIESLNIFFYFPIRLKKIYSLQWKEIDLIKTAHPIATQVCECLVSVGARMEIRPIEVSPLFFYFPIRLKKIYSLQWKEIDLIKTAHPIATQEIDRLSSRETG